MAKKSKRASGRKKSAKKHARRSVSKKAKAKHAVSRKAKARKAGKPAGKAARKARASKAGKKATAKPAKGKFNLIVTYNPNHRGTAEHELNEVLRKIGEQPRLGATEVEGLFKIAVSDARKVVKRLRDLCRAEPNLFTATHHYTPVDNWCKSEIAAMQKLVKEVSKGIAESDKWKLGLNKRHWDKMEGTPLIIKLAAVIDTGNVDLGSPEKIVQVDIIGANAGISLLNADEILDVPKTKDES